MADGLILPDGLAHGVTGFGVIDGFFQRAAGNADRSGGYVGTAAVEHFHGDHEAVAFVAQQVAGGNAHIVEDHFGRVGSVLAHFVERFAHAHPFPIPLDDKAAHPLIPLFGVGVGENGVEIGNRRPGDEGFAAVEDVIVPIFAGGRFDSGYVRSRFRFGEAIGGQIAVHNTAAILCLLFLISGNQNRQQPQPVDSQGGADAGTAPGQLLGHQTFVKHGQIKTAIFFGDAHGGQPQLLRLFDDRPGVFMRFVIMLGDRGDFVLGEIPRQLLNHLLFFSQMEGYGSVVRHGKIS